MPKTRNLSARHETFCRLIATPQNGLTAGRAYETAGFKAKARSADSCACEMLTRPNIKLRIAELMAPAAKKVQITRETLSEMFHADRDFARDLNQAGAAHQAAVSIGKLHGVYQEKMAIEVKVSTAMTGEDVAREYVEGALAADASPHAAANILKFCDQVRDAVLAWQARQAPALIDVTPAKTTAKGEAEASLIAIRRGPGTRVGR